MTAGPTSMPKAPWIVGRTQLLMHAADAMELLECKQANTPVTTETTTDNTGRTQQSAALARIAARRRNEQRQQQ